MKRIIWMGSTITILIIIILIFLNIKQNDKSGEIKIGAILPLTGEVAIIGKPTQNAIELAVRKYESKFLEKGYKLILETEDTEAKPGIGVSALNKLIKVNKVKFIIGPMASSVAHAVLPISNKNKVIVVSPSASSPDLSKDDYFFRVELSEAQGAQKQAELALKKLKYRKISCLYVNNDYGRGTFQVFSKTFEKIGGKIIFESPFDEGTTDFRSILSKIKNKNDDVDALFIVFNTEITNIIRQMKEIGLKIKVFTTPVFENTKYLNELESDANGIIYTYYGQFDPKSNKNEVTDFISKYKNNFKTEPGYYSALGYDAANVLLNTVLSSVPDVSCNKIKKKLLTTKYEGVTGSITFDKDGDPEKMITLKIVRNIKFENY